MLIRLFSVLKKPLNPGASSSTQVSKEKSENSMEQQNHPRVRGPPLERNIQPVHNSPEHSTSPTIPPTRRIQSEEEIFADLQDIYVQYLMCDDPTETAARRVRLQQGEMEASARNLFNAPSNIMPITDDTANTVVFEQIPSPEQQLILGASTTRPASRAKPNRSLFPADQSVNVSPKTKKRGRLPVKKKTINNSTSPTIPPTRRIQSEEEIFADLQDISVQYMMCDDPTENAARRVRLQQGDPQGEMEASARNLFNAPSNIMPITDDTANTVVFEQIPSPEQQFIRGASTTRPASGAKPNRSLFPADQSVNVSPKTKKRGRLPVKKKTTNNSPKMVAGISGKPRKMHTVSQSPTRVSTKSKAGPSRVNTTDNLDNLIIDTDPLQASNPTGTGSSNQASNPIIQLIPPMAKKKADFQNPADYLP